MKFSSFDLVDGALEFFKFARLIDRTRWAKEAHSESLSQKENIKFRGRASKNQFYCSPMVSVRSPNFDHIIWLTTTTQFLLQNFFGLTIFWLKSFNWRAN